KAGYHTDGVIKVENAYQHIEPALVGNERRLLVSELGGSRGLLDKLDDLQIDYPFSREEARGLTERIKDMDARGFQFEGADGSLEMLVRRTLPGYKAPFHLDDFWVVLRRSDKSGDPYAHKEMQAEAMVKVSIPGRGEGEDRVIQTAADGDGPVDALS